MTLNNEDAQGGLRFFCPKIEKEEKFMDFGMEYFVKKKDRRLEPWDSSKIVTAIRKSADRVLVKLSEQECAQVVGFVETKLFTRSDNVIDVETLHSLVEQALKTVNMEVAESYINYRNFIKKNAEMWTEIFDETEKVTLIGDKSNANADSALCSTIKAKESDILETKFFEEYNLNKREREAAKIGYIYVHDKSGRRRTMNCCLFDYQKVLTGGFEMGNIWYNEPKGIDTASDVIGDITLMAASQQYGGFTLPEIDKGLSKYAEKSFNKLVDKYVNVCKMPEEAAKALAKDEVIHEIEQGFQGWEYKFNTVASSRGDYPFITVTFGLDQSEWGREISKAALRVRRGGQGKEGHKKPVLFPKLVFLYDENLHGAGKPLEDVFEEAVSCSSKTMYPDYLSLTGEGYVPEMYKKYGKVVSPMGCRAFLSPWYEKGGMYPADENDKPLFVGRFNVGVVSLNLPMILAKSRRDDTNFYRELDTYLEMIRGIHKKTYELLKHKKASLNPLGFCQGGFLGGNLGLNDSIEPVLRSSTASFGITALNELQQLYNGKSLAEDGQFALEVMDYINKKIAEFKEEDHILYAIYGTPAESLCGLQIKQFRKEFGYITNVSDREYVSNSFHCHVTEKISPIRKQDLEKRFWDKFNGGKIQYVRYTLGYNTDAIRSLVRRAMDMGFYEGVNLSLSYCDDCGYEQLEMDVCPKCGSRNLTKIDRMNGYLAYSRVHGDTRLNAAKMAEIKERVSM